MSLTGSSIYLLERARATHSGSAHTDCLEWLTPFDITVGLGRYVTVVLGRLALVDVRAAGAVAREASGAVALKGANRVVAGRLGLHTRIRCGSVRRSAPPLSRASERWVHYPEVERGGVSREVKPFRQNDSPVHFCTILIRTATLEPVSEQMMLKIRIPLQVYDRSP